MTATPRLDLRGLTGAQGKTGRDRPIATGLAASRPAANLITPDSFYYATDTGALSHSDGTTWSDVVPGVPAGTELAYFTRSARDGPTGVTTTGNGDALFEFPSATYEAVKHYFELNVFAGSNIANGGLYFRLHEGTSAAPGTLIDEVEVDTPSAAGAIHGAFRVPFVPAAGTRQYAVRWRASVAATWTLYNDINVLVSRIVRA